MCNEKHPHEEMILAYYRGEQVQFRQPGATEWANVTKYNPSKSTGVSSLFPPLFLPEWEYRIKPKTKDFTLTEEEAEYLLCLLGRVDGRAMRVTSNLNTALRKFIGYDRAERLYQWRSSPENFTGHLNWHKPIPANL